MSIIANILQPQQTFEKWQNPVPYLSSSPADGEELRRIADAMEAGEGESGSLEGRISDNWDRHAWPITVIGGAGASFCSTGGAI